MNEDMLAEMFDRQQVLNERCGVVTTGISDERKCQLLRDYCLAIGQEIAELIDSTPWKWWAYYQTFDEPNSKIEVIDILHFTISLAQVLGMSAQDVYEMYLAKNDLNHKRQNLGYSEKDEADNEQLGNK